MKSFTERYRQYRADRTPANAAAVWARAPRIEDYRQISDRVISFVWREFEVQVSWCDDVHADRSWRGSFTDRPKSPGHARRLHDGSNSSLYQYFEPGITAAEHRDSLIKMGYSRGRAEELAQSYVTEDLRAARGDIYPPVVLTVQVLRNEVTLAETSLGDVEIGEHGVDAEDVIEYLAGDSSLLDDAVATAQNRLTRLRA